MTRIIKKLTDRVLSIDKHTKEVIKKSLYSTYVKILGICFLFFISVILGRTLGPEGLGIINLADRIIVVLGVLCLFGLPQLTIKQTAIAFSKKNWKEISQKFVSSNILAFTITILIVVIFSIFAETLSNTFFKEPELYFPFSILLIGLIAQTHTRIIASFLVGFRKIWQSNLLNDTLSVILSGASIFLLHTIGKEITLKLVAIIYVLTRVLTVVISRIYWKYVFKERERQRFEFSFKILKDSAPFLFINATAIIMSNTDIIMLGWLTNAQDVGLYSVASKLALFTSFFLQVSNTAISPKIAALYSANKIVDINRMVQRVTMGLIVIALITIMIFYFLGNDILRIWGEGFEHSFIMLMVLATGQFFNISTGCAGYVLTMCGFEKLQAKVIFFFVILNIVLSYFLIRQFGVLGAAISTSITIASENVTKVILAYRKTKINTVPLGIFFKTHNDEKE